MWSAALGTTVPPPRLPPPHRFRPLSPRQGAPLGAGPLHGSESARRVPRPPSPGSRTAPCCRVFVNSAQLLFQNIRVCGKDPLPPPGFSQDPRPLGESIPPRRLSCHRPPLLGPQSHPAPALHPGKLPSQSCAPAPWGGLLIPTLASLHTSDPEWASTPSPSPDTWQNPRREPPPAPICYSRGRRLRLEPEQ